MRKINDSYMIGKLTFPISTSLCRLSEENCRRNMDYIEPIYSQLKRYFKLSNIYSNKSSEGI
ncbi:hypothetical protein ND16A_3633 [Thalassotalea sp. ND16A]|nr:hypothetical protein ND16A_3633 [Thalassotalea sp. ND16A]